MQILSLHESFDPAKSSPGVATTGSFLVEVGCVS